jgi:hypothetical protein
MGGKRVSLKVFNFFSLRLSVIVLPCSFLLGCLSFNDPDLVAQLENWKSAASGTKVTAASSRFQPMVVRNGQFTQYLLTDREGTVSGVRIQALEPGDLAHSQWFEIDWITSSSQKVSRVMIFMDEARIAVSQRNPDAFEPAISDFVKPVRLFKWEKGDSKLEEIEKSDVESEGKKVGKISLLGALQLGKKKKVASKAGVFAGCFESTSTGSLGGKSFSIKGCVDSQVPLSGLVEGTDSQGRHWELISFGVVGGKSSIVLPAK